MKRLLLAAALTALTAASAFAAEQPRAAWWLENDYSFGSNGLRKDSLTVYRKTSAALTTGLNLSFYKDTGAYGESVYSLRLPLMYSRAGYFVSFKPFLYPVSPDTRSGAYGGKLYFLTALGEEQNDSYTHLILSGAWAQQKAFLSEGGVLERKTFSQAAAEVQVEKSFFNQFFFLASAAGFGEPGRGARNSTLVKPVMDQADLAYLGVFRPLTALPEWALSAQVARNMQPDYDSHIYAGYSKISFRQAEKAGSFIAGLKLNLNEKSTLDLAYNAFKAENSAPKSYYRLLLQLFF
jgi:opacity protein-like surface antigen